MSNYVQTTFFAPKDALPPGNPSKTIFGAAYDVEFGNIATAITSKYDSTNLATAVQAQTGTSNSVLLTPSTYSSAAQASAGVYWPDTGAVNNMVITPVPAITAYTTGQYFRIKVANTTTTTGCFLNVNGLGAKSVVNPTDFSGTAVGQLRANQTIDVLYDSAAGAFVLQYGSNSIYGAVTITNTGGSGTGVTLSVSGATAGGGNSVVALFTSGSPGTSTNADVQIVRAGSTQNSAAGKGPNILLSDSGNSGNISLQCTSTAANTAQLELWAGTIEVLKAGISGNVPFIAGQGATLGSTVDLTPDAGSVVLTLTGCTTSPTATAVWDRIGNLVMMWIPAVSATSNTTGGSLTGLPAAITPTRAQNIACYVEDNTVLAAGGIQVSGTTLTLLKNSGTALTATLTNGGTKGIPSGAFLCWILN